MSVVPGIQCTDPTRPLQIQSQQPLRPSVSPCLEIGLLVGT